MEATGNHNISMKWNNFTLFLITRKLLLIKNMKTFVKNIKNSMKYLELFSFDNCNFRIIQFTTFQKVKNSYEITNFEFKICLDSNEIF